MEPNKKYKLTELKKGMQVRESQLTNILDTPMILVDTHIINNNDLIGTLAFFGHNEREYEEWFEQSKPITPIYFNSEELEDGVVYDE